jgi:hypothetical protein
MRPMVTARSPRLQYCFCIFLMVIALMATSGCEQNSNPSESEIAIEKDNSPGPVTEQPSKAEEEPLLLLEDEPLLLLEDDAAVASSNGPAADNTRCFVCHANYLDEEIAVTHAQANIGCARCHGESDAHIADESWGSGGNGTAPDIMYPREKINPSCMRCHPKGQIETPQHEPVFATGPEKKVCTDCHGNHRLTVRRCTWK